MSKQTEVILIKNVKGLGKLGDRKTVKMGYAFNYLIPQEMALLVTKDNLYRFDSVKQKELKRLEQVGKDAVTIREKLHGKEVIIEAATHDDGKLYGSVTVQDIVAAIKSSFDVDVDKQKVDLSNHLREIGFYPVALDLHPEVECVINVLVKSDGEDIEDLTDYDEDDVDASIEESADAEDDGIQEEDAPVASAEEEAEEEPSESEDS